ncbi:MAG: DUF4145 domain-containing protein [Pseudomonadota bacterium]
MARIWQNIATLEARRYQCGFCGEKVASDIGFFAGANIGGYRPYIHICPNCSKPSFFLGPSQVPGVVPGNPVDHLPEDIERLYGEARRCISVGAFTASVLASRKLLMNIGVAHGAKEGLPFVQYINHLADMGFIPPNGRGWVDHIRTKGNEATHEIAIMSGDDALELIAFAEMLLKFVFEFPAKVPAAPGE